MKPSDDCGAAGLGWQGEADTSLGAGSPVLRSNHRGIAGEECG